MIRAIIVLYKCDYNSSQTLQSLEKLEDKIKSIISVDIYDNSPENSKIDYRKKLTSFKEITYIHDKTNPGLSAAYNYSLCNCKDKGEKWLLLLDQDTVVPNEFFSETLKIINKESSIQDVAAIIPDIINNDGEPIVPVRVSAVLGRYSFMTEKDTLVSNEVRTINSCSLINVGFMNEISGFNNQFNLDCLDHWLFHMIYAQKRLVFLTHVKVKHNLSINNHQEYVSVKRYKSILESEQLFYSKYNSKLRYTYFKIQLFKRALKQAVLVKNKKIYKMTIKKIFGYKL